MASTSFSSNHVARIALLSVASVLAIVSIFLAWWVIDAEFNGGGRETAARPFAAGDMADDEDDNEGNGLSSEVIVTGILASLATLAVIAYLALELLPIMGRTAQPVPRLIMAFVSMAFGLAAVLYTTFAWPEGAGGDMSFFDEISFDNFAGDGSVTTYAGAGWWMAIVATIVLPLAAFITGLRDPRASPANT